MRMRWNNGPVAPAVHLLAVAAVGTAITSVALATPTATTVRFRLLGFGTPLPTAIDSGSCP
jgi:hypothetical protein